MKRSGDVALRTQVYVQSLEDVQTDSEEIHDHNGKLMFKVYQLR